MDHESWETLLKGQNIYTLFGSKNKHNDSKHGKRSRHSFFTPKGVEDKITIGSNNTYY